MRRTAWVMIVQDGQQVRFARELKITNQGNYANVQADGFALPSGGVPMIVKAVIVEEEDE